VDCSASGMQLKGTMRTGGVVEEGAGVGELPAELLEGPALLLCLLLQRLQLGARTLGRGSPARPRCVLDNRSSISWGEGGRGASHWKMYGLLQDIIDRWLQSWGHGPSGGGHLPVIVKARVTNSKIVQKMRYYAISCDIMRIA